MANVLDYIHWRGDLPIVNGEINEVDAMILSRLSYLPFDGYVSSSLTEYTTIREATAKMNEDPGVHRNILWKGDPELLIAAGKCDRFGKLRISGFVNIVEDNDAIQFCAMIIELDSENRFISFRGTDNSIIGWQEDFNMYTTFPLPSQLEAVKYFETAVRTFPGNFYLGGHSKGGNLAIFTASFCAGENQHRIREVYNLDGPGFDLDAMEHSRYKYIKDHIHTYVPQSSMFGMMLEHEESFTIIKSVQKGFFQHDIFSWQIEPTKLVKLSEMTDISIFFDRTLRDFLSRLNQDERRNLIEVIFNVLKETDDRTFNEMAENWRKDSGVIFKSIKNLDSEARSLLLSNIGVFIKCAANNFSDLNPIKRKREKAKQKATDNSISKTKYEEPLIKLLN